MEQFWDVRIVFRAYLRQTWVALVKLRPKWSPAHCTHIVEYISPLKTQNFSIFVFDNRFLLENRAPLFHLAWYTDTSTPRIHSCCTNCVAEICPLEGAVAFLYRDKFTQARLHIARDCHLFVLFCRRIWYTAFLHEKHVSHIRAVSVEYRKYTSRPVPALRAGTARIPALHAGLAVPVCLVIGPIAEFKDRTEQYFKR